jgi:DNA-binding transcriptional MerR regulator
MSTDTTGATAESTELAFLTTNEFATRVRSNSETVRYWRKIGYGPKGIRVGRRVLYRATDVNAWLNRLASEQTGDAS